MATRQIKPITPGQRHRIAPVFDDITISKPLKSLTLVMVNPVDVIIADVKHQDIVVVGISVSCG